MDIAVGHQALERLAQATGSQGSGLAGTVDTALEYQSRWTAKGTADSTLFFQFAGQAEQMHTGVADALGHMREAFDGFSRAVAATSTDFGEADETGAETYHAMAPKAV